MKLIKEVRTVGTGAAISSADVTVQTWPSGILVGSGETDTEGLVTIQAQGSPGAIRTRVSRGGPIYDEYSENVQPTGSFDLDHLRDRINALVTDGVITTYGDNFRITIGSGSITLASGGVVLDGIVALFPQPTILTMTDGDRAAVAVVSDETVSLADIAYSAIVSGTHVPLYRYTVTSGQVVPSSVTSISRRAGPRAARKAVFGISRANSGTTANASGEASALTTTLDLESGTYDIRARVTALGLAYDGAFALNMGAGVGTYRSLNGDIKSRITNADARTGVVGPASVTVTAYHRRDTAATFNNWTALASYGPTFNSVDLNSPSQVAVDGTGRILIADTDNDRLVILTSGGAYSTGITSLSGVTGVCVDASSNIYVVYDGGTNIGATKYNSSLVLQWSKNLSGTSSAGGGHCTTDGTHLWVCSPNDLKVYKRLCSDGTAVSSFGSAGSGNGQFGTDGPTGIAYHASTAYLWVSDGSQSRIQRFTTAGAYVDSIFPPGSPTAIGIGASGNIFVSIPNITATYEYVPSGPGFTTSYVHYAGPSNANGIGVATGDVLWIANGANTVTKWDEVSGTPNFDWAAGLLTATAIPR